MDNDSAENDNAVYSFIFTVDKDSTDQNQHVNNVVYLQWMQDLAIKHADKSGCAEIVSDLGAIWVVFSHRIEYLSPAFAGDRIEASTWVKGYSRVKALRCYQFVRTTDKKVLAGGETEWVLLDSKTSRPRAIPERIRKVIPPSGGSCR